MPQDEQRLVVQTDYQIEPVTRRHFFRECGIGVGKIALAAVD